jgi:hypothetical protein
MECHEWPIHFPSTNCPDAQALPTDGPVFHFVRGDRTDFKSAMENGRFKNHPPCERAALSCFVRLEDAVQTKENLTALFGDHWIAQANLSPKHGKIKSTPTGTNRGHPSLWLRMQYIAVCRQLFRVLE